MKKGEEPGWQVDLAHYAADYDLLLLQEAVMTPAVREVIEGAGLRWQMAGAFAQGGEERGVLVAARVAPLDGCTLRAFEPLFPLPKSAMVVRYRLAGRAQTLAVANLHGINFTLGIARFQEQIEAVAAELARHEGPMVLAGAFQPIDEMVQGSEGGEGGTLLDELQAVIATQQALLASLEQIMAALVESLG